MVKIGTKGLEHKNIDEPRPSTVEQKAQEIKASLEATKKKAEEAEKKAEEAEKKAAEQATQIDNLDKSVKEMKAENEELKKSIEKKQVKSFDEALHDAMTEHKDEMEKFIKANTFGKMSFKFTTPNITNTSLGVQLDQNVYADRIAAFAFYDSFRKTGQSGNSLEWLEGTDTDKTGYIGELTESQQNTYSLAGKTRKFAKIGSYIQVSQEIVDWFNQVYNWARTRGVSRILQKADQLIWNGDGSDATQPNHIYGIKTSGSTAFAATGAKYKNANLADVILDAIAQAKKNGFIADIAFVSFKSEAVLRGLKDESGNYIYNQATSMLGQVRVVSTANIGDDEVLVADSLCVEIIEKGQYELELERVAGKDGWNCWLRKTMQVKVPTSEKKGVIYVASVATAITAIAETAK